VTDIVERLRALDAWALHDATEVMRQGADVIERLRGALQLWRSSGCWVCGGDCGSANPPVDPEYCPMQVARAALGEDGDVR
jgi:hypothetical protein